MEKSRCVTNTLNRTAREVRSTTRRAWASARFTCSSANNSGENPLSPSRPPSRQPNTRECKIPLRGLGKKTVVNRALADLAVYAIEAALFTGQLSTCPPYIETALVTSSLAWIRLKRKRCKAYRARRRAGLELVGLANALQPSKDEAAHGQIPATFCEGSADVPPFQPGLRLVHRPPPQP